MDDLQILSDWLVVWHLVVIQLGRLLAVVYRTVDAHTFHLHAWSLLCHASSLALHRFRAWSLYLLVCFFQISCKFLTRWHLRSKALIFLSFTLLNYFLIQKRGKRRFPRELSAFLRASTRILLIKIRASQLILQFLRKLLRGGLDVVSNEHALVVWSVRPSRLKHFSHDLLLIWHAHNSCFICWNLLVNAFFTRLFWFISFFVNWIELRFLNL